MDLLTLPSTAIIHIVDKYGKTKTYTQNEILNMIPDTNRSFVDVMSERVYEMLAPEDKDLHMYMLNKAWIGNDLIYSEEIEKRLSKYHLE